MAALLADQLEAVGGQQLFQIAILHAVRLPAVVFVAGRLQQSSTSGTVTGWVLPKRAGPLKSRNS
jgi:hypothetical protein